MFWRAMATKIFRRNNRIHWEWWWFKWFCSMMKKRIHNINWCRQCCCSITILFRNLHELFIIKLFLHNYNNSSFIFFLQTSFFKCHTWAFFLNRHCIFKKLSMFYHNFKYLHCSNTHRWYFRKSAGVLIFAEIW